MRGGEDQKGLCPGDRVALTACSDLLPRTAKGQIRELCGRLRKIGLESTFREEMFGDTSLDLTGREKAEILNGYYRDEKIRAVFDVSGGNGDNEILPWVDWEAVQEDPKPFWGYSDCSVILNALLTRTGHPGVLWQIRNLVREQGKLQQIRFENWLTQANQELFQPNWQFCRGNFMEGILAGGNLRCFLKLAGTPYFPDLTGKILFLESLGGGPELLASLLSQLGQLGVFQKISGLLFGTFTELEKNPDNPGILKLLGRQEIPPNLPIAVTREAGHGADAKALLIGKKISLRAEA